MSIIIEFKTYTEFEKLDISDWIFPYEATDEEYIQLKNAYEELIIYATNDFLEYDRELVEDYIQEAIDEGEIENEKEWRSDMVYRIWIDWLKELKKTIINVLCLERIYTACVNKKQSGEIPDSGRLIFRSKFFRRNYQCPQDHKTMSDN